MLRYKISVTYENHSFDEVLEIRAESPYEAGLICEEVKERNHRTIERLAGLNVFFSKKIKEVKILE